MHMHTNYKKHLQISNILHLNFASLTKKIIIEISKIITKPNTNANKQPKQ